MDQDRRVLGREAIRSACGADVSFMASEIDLRIAALDEANLKRE